MHGQEGSRSYFQEKIRQSSDEGLFLTLKEEIKWDNEALEMRWPSIETKMDANMIADMATNSKNLNE